MKILLDNGHGEETPGKCSPVWPDGSCLREYEFARDIVRRVFDRLHARGVVAEIIVPELRDVPLYVRANRVNGICDVAGKENCLLVSVHANAGGGTGWEAHTYLGDSMSDRYSALFYEKAESSTAGGMDGLQLRGTSTRFAVRGWIFRRVGGDVSVRPDAKHRSGGSRKPSNGVFCACARNFHRFSFWSNSAPEKSHLV